MVAKAWACGCVTPSLHKREMRRQRCRFIGVDRLVIYRPAGSWDASPRSNTATVLHRKLSASESGSSSAANHAVRQKCLDETQEGVRVCRLPYDAGVPGGEGSGGQANAG